MEVVANVGVIRRHVRFLSKTGGETCVVYNEICWKAKPKKVIVLYVKYNHTIILTLLSTTGLVKPCRNLPGLSGKAKYMF